MGSGEVQLAAASIGWFLSAVCCDRPLKLRPSVKPFLLICYVNLGGLMSEKKGAGTIRDRQELNLLPDHSLWLQMMSPCGRTSLFCLTTPKRETSGNQQFVGFR